MIAALVETHRILGDPFQRQQRVPARTKIRVVASVHVRRVQMSYIQLRHCLGDARVDPSPSGPTNRCKHPRKNPTSAACMARKHPGKYCAQTQDHEGRCHSEVLHYRLRQRQEKCRGFAHAYPGDFGGEPQSDPYAKTVPTAPHASRTCSRRCNPLGQAKSPIRGPRCACPATSCLF